MNDYTYLKAKLQLLIDNSTFDEDKKCLLDKYLEGLNDIEELNKLRYYLNDNQIFQPTTSAIKKLLKKLR